MRLMIEITADNSVISGFTITSNDIRLNGGYFFICFF
jgi:hypothetical protein